VRLGGDEFLVLLPECTLEQLQLVLGRLGSMEVDWHGQTIPVTFSAGWKQYEVGEQPEELLARADQVLYDRKRASKNTDGASAAIEKEAPLHVLVDVTCPHCRKQNSVAVEAHPGASNDERREVQCAYCKKGWQPALSGTVMAGPFPK
jgi:GGDEF domain-containing protein